MNGFQHMLPLFFLAIGFSLGRSTGVIEAQHIYRSPASTEARVFHPSNLAIRGRVTKVIDGDTFEILSGQKKWKVRISGIDSPEVKQAYGKEAKDYAASYLVDEVVSVYKPQICQDRYGRILGVVQSDLKKSDFGHLMLKKGFAHFNKKYSYEYDPAISKAYAESERKAKTDNVGLWKQDGSKIKTPWEFRRQNR